MDECNDVWNSAKRLMVNKLANLVLLSRSYGQRQDSMFNILMHHSWMNQWRKKYGLYIFLVSVKLTSS